MFAVLKMLVELVPELLLCFVRCLVLPGRLCVWEWWQGWKVVDPRWIAELVALLSEECVVVVIVVVACAERDPKWCAAVR